MMNYTRGIYVLYGLIPGGPRTLGLKFVPRARYLARLFDPVIGTPKDLIGGFLINHPGGQLSVVVPGTSAEAVLYLERQG